MDRNWPKINDWVHVSEGGFVNHPKDPGKATNMGITQATLSAHLGYPATVADVRNLTEETADAIYYNSYWLPIAGPRLPDGLDYAVYDFGVNSGVSRAARFLQGIVGVKQDGVIGEITLAAVRKFNTLELIDLLCDKRMAFLRRLKTFKTFGRGWTRRVEGEELGTQKGDIGVRDRAAAMALGRMTTPPVTIDDGANAKAVEEDETESAHLVDAITDPKAVGTALTSLAGFATALSDVGGPIGYAIAGVLILGTLTGIYLLVRRAT